MPQASAAAYPPSKRQRKELLLWCCPRFGNSAVANFAILPLYMSHYIFAILCSTDTAAALELYILVFYPPIEFVIKEYYVMYHVMYNYAMNDGSFLVNWVSNQKSSKKARPRYQKKVLAISFSLSITKVKKRVNTKFTVVVVKVSNAAFYYYIHTQYSFANYTLS